MMKWLLIAFGLYLAWELYEMTKAKPAVDIAQAQNIRTNGGNNGTLSNPMNVVPRRYYGLQIYG